MSKNNTLCIAEWQVFGVEDIFHAIKPCHIKNLPCHTERSEVSKNDNKDLHAVLDSSVASLPQNDKEKLHDKAQKFFNELKNFADDKGNHIFLNSYGKNRLKARNYVGLIQTKSGFCLEILPKTFRTASENDGFKIQNCACSSLQDKTNLFSCHTERSEVSQNLNKNRDISVSTKPQYDNVNFLPTAQNDKKMDCHADKSARNDNAYPLRHPNAREGESLPNKRKKCPVCEAKNILLNMLQTLRDSPFKQSHISNLKTHKFPLLEIFANMFLDELECLIKRGIKSDYVEREENRAFLKGKLLFNENLKHNFAHKERFYTASDEFIADIAPNRLIVSTLLLLSKCNFSAKTSGRILQSRFVFDEICPSQNYDKDFAKCENLRHFKSYEILLLWCKIFLKRHNFMPYQGGDKAFALLFDMNALFESFVAWHLKRECGEGHSIKAQEKSKYLVEINGERKFQINPDLVCYENGAKSARFIADTKWKILDSSRNDYGISQGDLYQLFAYLAKYQCDKGYLIYPKITDTSRESNSTQEAQIPRKFTYKARICFFDENRFDEKQLDENQKENPKTHKKQNFTLQIYFFDCQEVKNSLDSIKLLFNP
ncbi:McrC family protein [Helicobacter sp. 23-1046]